MANVDEIGAQRWYAVPDDMSVAGSWCVMNVGKTPVASDPATGELQIARYLCEQEARRIADLHNAELAGRPSTRPERYRVLTEDALVFDEIGEALGRADTLFEANEVRGVLREALRAMNLLTEVA